MNMKMENSFQVNLKVCGVRKLTEGYKSAVQHAKFDCVRYRRETGRCGARFLLFRLLNVHIPRLGSTKATSKSKVFESRLKSKRKERKTLIKAEAKRGSSSSRVMCSLIVTKLQIESELCLLITFDSKHANDVVSQL